MPKFYIDLNKIGEATSLEEIFTNPRLYISPNEQTEDPNAADLIDIVFEQLANLPTVVEPPVLSCTLGLIEYIFGKMEISQGPHKINE